MFFYIVLTPISTTFGLCSTGNTRKYQQIDIYIYQCDVGKWVDDWQQLIFYHTFFARIKPIITKAGTYTNIILGSRIYQA